MQILEPTRQQVDLPAWREVRQNFPHHGLPSVTAAVRAELEKPDIRARIRPGMRVAVGVGSRGINNLAEAVRALVAGLQALGAEPFIVPAMGSHGGGTAEGQLEVLSEYGVTEAGVGAPIRASMEVVKLGEVLDGVEVFIDRIAYTEAEAIIPVARVKPHTDFRGEIESGLHKMIGIGLGKHRGASSLHTFPMHRFGELLPVVGELMLKAAPIPFALALVEDSYEDTAIVEAVPSERMLEREKELLAWGRAWLPRLPFEQVDVLIVQEIGKNISGAGMDPNVTARYSHPSLPRHLQIGRLLVLDLTETSHGNACGIGFADITTRRAADQIDWQKTYTNVVAAGLLDGARLPLVAGNDREALAIALQTLWGVEPTGARIAWIKNTLSVQQLWVSEPLWAELAARDDIAAVGDFEPMRFADDGALLVGQGALVAH